MSNGVSRKLTLTESAPSERVWEKLSESPTDSAVLATSTTSDCVGSPAGVVSGPLADSAAARCRSMSRSFLSATAPSSSSDRVTRGVHTYAQGNEKHRQAAADADDQPLAKTQLGEPVHHGTFASTRIRPSIPFPVSTVDSMRTSNLSVCMMS